MHEAQPYIKSDADIKNAIVLGDDNKRYKEINRTTYVSRNKQTATFVIFPLQNESYPKSGQPKSKSSFNLSLKRSSLDDVESCLSKSGRAVLSAEKGSLPV